MKRGYPTKGPGDVWPAGDTTATYCEYDAHADIATKLQDADDVAELVGDVIRARAALDWIVFNVDLPRQHRAEFDLLRMQSDRLSGMESEYARLFSEHRS